MHNATAKKEPYDYVNRQLKEAFDDLLFSLQTQPFVTGIEGSDYAAEITRRDMQRIWHTLFASKLILKIKIDTLRNVLDFLEKEIS